MKFIDNHNHENIFKDLFHNKYFENSITTVILLAGIIVGMQTSKEMMALYGSILNIIDHIIVAIFVIEIIVGLLSEIPRPWRYFYDPWHIFDFIIVSACLIPLFLPDSHTEFFAIFRLARILRLAKIFEKIKSLKILLTSLLRSIPSMSYVIILLALLFYIYGVIATDLFGKYSDQYASIWGSMKTLLIVAFEGISSAIDDDNFKQTVALHYPEWVIITFFTSFLMIAAVIFLNLFIGIITSDIQTTKEDENRGKNKVYLKNHTVILGWNSSIIKILMELIEANDSNERANIVILSNKEKKEMESIINDNISDTKTTIIKCRNGKPSIMDDLELTNYRFAKSILILQNEDDDNPDISILKAIIGLTNFQENRNLKIISEMTNPDIIEKVKSITDDVIIFEKNMFISKLIAQSALQPYLSKVHIEITGFSGSEFYIIKDKKEAINQALLGLSYKDILFKFKTSCPIGFLIGDKVVLNPKPDDIFKDGFKLIVLAEDDSTIRLHEGKIKLNSVDKAITKNDNNVKNILILGSNNKLLFILQEIDSYLEDIVNITLVSQYEEEFNQLIEAIKQEQFKNLKIDLIKGDIDNKNLLLELTDNKDSVILLSYYDHNFDTQNSDAITLVSLIHLRDIAKNNNRDFHIVAEMIDDKNREIINNPNVSDFIVSSQIASSILAQLSEEPYLFKIFQTLLTAEGGEIYLRNAENYFDLDQTFTFADMVAQCIKNNETAIGIITFEGKKDKILVNPSKDYLVKLKKGDKLILISEEI